MSKVECSQYESCLSNLNQTVLNNLQEIKENALQVYDNPEEEEDAETPKIDSVPMDPAVINKNMKVMLSQLTVALETCGVVNPYNKVYYLTKPIENMSVFMHLFTLAAL